jgi:energy-coupling factor transporter ATP-binding protein EcfA2
VTGFDPGAVALVLDDPRRQFVASTVAREVAFALESRLTDPGVIRERVRETLEEFAVHGLGDREPLRVSAGEQQLALLAAALAPGPALLLLDDPFVYLDPGTAFSCWRRVQSLVARGRISAAVLATHDVELASTADAVAVLGEGRVLDWGVTADVLARPLPAGLAPALSWRVERGLRVAGYDLVPGESTPESLATRVAWACLPGSGPVG